MKRNYLLSLALTAVAHLLCAQSNRTITIGDATNDFNGTHEYLGAESGRFAHLTWDANKLYIGITGNPIVNTSSNLYVVVDTDPASAADPRSGNGRSDQPTGEAGGATYPFNADAVYLIYGSGGNDAGVVTTGHGLKYTVSGGSWTNTNLTSAVEVRRHGNDITDVAIAFDDLGIAEHASFNVLIYVANNSGGGSNFAQWPTNNPNGNNLTDGNGGNPLTHYYTFTRKSGVNPNAQSNLSIRTYANSFTFGELNLANLSLIGGGQTYNCGALTRIYHNLYIGNGALFTMGNKTAALQLDGNVTITGILLLSSNIGGDLYLGGNLEQNSLTGTFNPNGRAVFFNGSGDQTIGLSSPNQTVTFSYLFVDKSGGSLRLTNQTNLRVNGIAGVNAFDIAEGSFDLNGQTLTIRGGDFNNDGLFTANNGTVVFDANTVQSINGSSTTQFDRLTVNKSVSLTLNSPVEIKRTLTIAGSGNVQGDGSAVRLTLLSDADATASVVNSGGGIFVGLGAMQRYVPDNSGLVTGATAGPGYKYFGIPFTDNSATAADFSAGGFTHVTNAANINQYNTDWSTANGVPFPNMFAYDESRINSSSTPNSSFSKGWLAIDPSYSFKNGQGFIVNMTPGNSSPAVFKGTFQQTTAFVNVSRQDNALGNSGWNLIGNPFPSAVSWDSVVNYNANIGTDIGNAIYIRNATGQYSGTWAQYVNGIAGGVGFDAGSHIAAMQGFFIRALSQGSHTIAFPNSARMADAQPLFYKTARTQQSIARLQVRNSQNLSDEAVIYYQEGASENADARFDAYKIAYQPANYPTLFAKAGKDYLSINGLPATHLAAIALGFYAPKADTYTFALTEFSRFGQTDELWLEDRLGQTWFNLTEGDFTFDAQQGLHNDRFYLHKRRVNETVAQTGLQLYAAEGILYGQFLRAADAVGTIEVFDLSGRLLVRSEQHAEVPAWQLQLPAQVPGILLVRFSNARQQISHKVSVY